MVGSSKTSNSNKEGQPNKCQRYRHDIFIVFPALVTTKSKIANGITDAVGGNAWSLMHCLVNGRMVLEVQFHIFLKHLIREVSSIYGYLFAILHVPLS